MKTLSSLVFFVFTLTTTSAFGADLTITDYDSTRQRATISLSQDTSIKMGTILRVNANSGTCNLEIVERVNLNLVAKTPKCTASILRDGLKLTYSQPATDSWGKTSEFNNEVEDVSHRAPAWSNDDSIMSDDEGWTSEGQFTTGSIATAAGWGRYAFLKDRISVYLGHNFTNDLEGKVLANGSVKDLGGDMAFTMGVQGRVYDISPRLGIVVGIGHEFNRTFDEATTIVNNTEVRAKPPTGNPKVRIWSLYTQVEASVMKRLKAFGGINFSLPVANGVYLDFDGDIGFQAGAAYEVIRNLDIEGLIKITNMDLNNRQGETTDVSLAGVELRGRYTF